MSFRCPIEKQLKQQQKGCSHDHPAAQAAITGWGEKEIIWDEVTGIGSTSPVFHIWC
jgi:hypothetical protein